MGTKAVEYRKKKRRYSEWKKAASIYSPMEEAKAMAQASEGAKKKKKKITPEVRNSI